MATRVVREGILIGVTVALLGCSGFNLAEREQVYFDPSYAPPPPPGQVEPALDLAEPTMSADTDVDIEPAAAMAIVQAPPRKPTLASRRFDPKRVVGLLGEPDNIREEPPATVWSYRTDECSLDVFFYLDLASQHYRALNYEVMVEDEQDSRRAIQRCLGRLQTVFRERGS